MNERLSQTEFGPESDLYTYELHGRTLQEWVGWLTTDRTTGQYSGHLATPGSRFSPTVEGCAYWAIAYQCAYVENSGEVVDPESTMGEVMDWCTSDSVEVAGLIADWYSSIPQVILDQIGTEDQIRRLDG